jgi:hypothetical protein
VGRGPIKTNFGHETPPVSDTNRRDNDIMIRTTVACIVTQMIGARCGT